MVTTATTETTPQTGVAPGTTDRSEPGTTTPAASGERTFSQADLDRIVKERLAEADQRRERALAKERETAEAKRLAEQGEWQAIAQRHEARVKELETALTERERDLTRRDLAAKHGLPAALAARIQGDDVAAMEADAVALAALLPAPGSSANPTNPAASRASRLTRDQIKLLSPDEINARWDEVSRVLAGG